MSDVAVHVHVRDRPREEHQHSATVVGAHVFGNPPAQADEFAVGDAHAVIGNYGAALAEPDAERHFAQTRRACAVAHPCHVVHDFERHAPAALEVIRWIGGIDPLYI